MPEMLSLRYHSASLNDSSGLYVNVPPSKRLPVTAVSVVALSSTLFPHTSVVQLFFKVIIIITIIIIITPLIKEPFKIFSF